MAPFVPASRHHQRDRDHHPCKWAPLKMALVDYSSSEDDEKKSTKSAIDETTTRKRKRENNVTSSDLPPLPSKFHNLYASTTRVSTRDDPSLHGGRKRVTPHIEGNWPTHIYIEWYLSTTEHGSLTKLISALKDGVASHVKAVDIHSFLTSDLGAPLPLHISLSRPISFPTDQKDSFVTSLDRAIKSSGIRPFDVSFSGLDWVANFENTRWFLVLRLRKPTADSLNRLLYVTNSVVQEHGQPPLYTKSPTDIKTVATKGNNKRGMKPNKSMAKLDWSNLQDVSDAFHFSIAWMLSSPCQELLELTKMTLKNHFTDMEKTRVGIEEIKSKLGNVVTSVPLPRNQVESNGLFGL